MGPLKRVAFTEISPEIHAAIVECEKSVRKYPFSRSPFRYGYCTHYFFFQLKKFFAGFIGHSDSADRVELSGNTMDLDP